jgi:type II secretory pathway pseudopilin PulG
MRPAAAGGTRMPTETSETAPRASPSPAARYDAFLSYTHRDTAMAVALQRELERLTKPWWRRRQLHVFRDESALAAGPALWTRLVSALTESRYLIVLASPAAARSEWTDREVGWWLDHRSVDQLVLAVVDGELHWDGHAGRFDPRTTNCLPPSLLERLAEEPLWVDLRGIATDQGSDRLAAPSAGIVAAITGKDKDEILGEDLRQHRRTRRTAVSALAVISVLALLATAAAVVALAQRDSARRSAAIAQARAFAAGAQASVGQDLDRSLLYAATAYRLHDDTSSHAALFQALSSDPHLVRFVPHSTPPTAQTWLGGSHVIADGGKDYLTVTDADSGSGRTVRISGSVTALAGTADGAGVVAATSAHTVSMIDARNGRMKWTASSASSSEVVSLSADQSSGLIAQLDQRGSVTIRRLADGATVGTGAPPPVGPYPPAPAFVGFLGGGSRLAVGDEEGELAILRLPDLSVLSPWSPWLGPGDSLPPSAYVQDGSSVSYILGGHSVAVSTVVGERPVPRFPDMYVTDMSALAVSDALDAVAFDADGRLEVAEPADELHPDGVITVLTGVSSTNSTLSFSADGSLLAGTNGATTAIWAPRSVSGAARALPDPLLSLCEACGNAPVAVDLHDSTIIWKAVQPDYTEHLLCGTQPSGRKRLDLPLSSQTVIQGLAVSPDGSRLVAADGSDGAVGWSVRNGCPVGSPASLAVGALGGDRSVDVLALKDGSVLLVGENQSVAWIDRTGKVVRLSPAVRPGDKYLPPPVVAAAPDGLRFAVGRPDGSLTAYRTGGAAPRKGWQADMGQQVQAVSYVSDDQIAVSTTSGDAVVLDAATGRVQHRLGGGQAFAVAGTNGFVVGVGGVQDRAALWSAADGSLLATFDFAPIALPLSSPGRLARVTSGYATTLVPDATGMWFFEVGTNPTRWALDPASWVATACRTAGRPLAPVEWETVTGSAAPGDLRCDRPR